MASLITIWNECAVWQSLYVLLTLQQMTPWELSRLTISWLVSTWGWSVCVCVSLCACRGTTSTECAAKFTKSFLFKYAVITRKADWYRWICMRFDSVDILCTVTVSLLANYHGKQMGQVTASSPKETGALNMLKMRQDDTVQQDFVCIHEMAFVLCEFGVSAKRSCQVLLSWTSTPALHWELEVSSLMVCMYS